MPKKPASTTVRTRDAERTKAAIFDAAAAEFAAHGYEGARVDTIAERSGVNKRMIYIYYGDKKGLYLEILRRKVLAMHEIFTFEWGLEQGSTRDSLVGYFNATADDPELLRFIQWEALETRNGSKVVVEDERAEIFRMKVDALKRDQKTGRLSTAVPAEYLMLMFMALSAYPIAFSQNTRMVTGLSPDDKRFQKRWADLLSVVAELLAVPE